MGTLEVPLNALIELAKIKKNLEQQLNALLVVEDYLVKNGFCVTCLDCSYWDVDKCKVYGIVPPNVLVEPAGKCNKLEFVPF